MADLDNAGTPDHDPNSLYQALSETGGQFTFGVENSTTVNGVGEGIVWDASSTTPADLEVGDGLDCSIIEITSSSNFAAALWVGMGIEDTTTAHAWSAACLQWGTTTTQRKALAMVSTACDTSSGALSGRGVYGIWPFSWYGAGSVNHQVLNVWVVNASGEPVYGESRLVATPSLTVANNQGFLCAGCQTNTDNGPHTATAKFRYLHIAKPDRPLT